MSGKSLFALLVAVLSVILIANSLYIVKETERAVLLRFGEVVNPDVKPGLHAKIPFVNNVRWFDGRVLTVDALPERFLTLEKKAVVVDSYAKWRVSDVKSFYTATGGDENRATALLAQRTAGRHHPAVSVHWVGESACRWRQSNCCGRGIPPAGACSWGAGDCPGGTWTRCSSRDARRRRNPCSRRSPPEAVTRHHSARRPIAGANSNHHEGPLCFCSTGR